MTASCFRTTIGRLVALGTILTFVTFQYIAVKSKSQLSFYELILQLSSCILLCNFLVVVARWAVYEPIQGLKNNDSLPYVNVIIPAYNESEFVRNSISSVLSSDYPREKVHIIVVDDGSTDDTWSHIQHALPAKSSALHTTIRHEINRGKRQAMVTAFEMAKSEILVTLDSDTILEKHTLRNLVSPFVLDSDVGGVAGHLSVFNIQSQGWDSFIPRILDCLFEQNGNIPRAAQSKHGFITILPGAISAFRRDAILPHTKALVDTRFLGRPMRHGEDVQLTMELLRDGWRLKYQSNAVGYTVAPETFLKAFLMYVRWERSNHTYWVLGLVRLAFRDAARFCTQCFAGPCPSEPELLPRDLEKQGSERRTISRKPDYHPLLMIFCAGFANFSYLSIVILWLRGFYFSPWVTVMNLGCLIVFATWFSTLLLADALHESESSMAVEGDVKESDETLVLRSEGSYSRLRKKLQYSCFSTVANFTFVCWASVIGLLTLRSQSWLTR
ncbi:nucleotide-diphospho-sugar transferase [Colletotrichum godetiae]|uniref:Nucleotide-diphospho-sugar transferase n=1 Tax=Colletotrichum godetiae TaxID=1209918 RepID=A0AAJ0ASX0_9PEZI|nr:nucleotide-diphospho-sugar transferase [Colletotrichum godetiae]KAK1688235.1 nucleotide-diphospho-sugar transferase [Colletotrichum godetiae]